MMEQRWFEEEIRGRRLRQPIRAFGCRFGQNIPMAAWPGGGTEMGLLQQRVFPGRCAAAQVRRHPGASWHNGVPLRVPIEGVESQR